MLKHHWTFSCFLTDKKKVSNIGYQMKKQDIYISAAESDVPTSLSFLRQPSSFVFPPLNPSFIKSLIHKGISLHH